MTESVGFSRRGAGTRAQGGTSARAALASWSLPVISLTLVMPGPAKNSELAARFLLKEAMAKIDVLCTVQGWTVRSFSEIEQAAGPEALYVVETEATTLKRALTELEESHERAGCGIMIIDDEEVFPGVAQGWKAVDAWFATSRDMDARGHGRIPCRN